MKKYFNMAAGTTIIGGSVAAFVGSFFGCQDLTVNSCTNAWSLGNTAPGIFTLVAFGGYGLAKLRDGYDRLKYPEDFLPPPPAEPKADEAAKTEDVKPEQPVQPPSPPQP